MKKSDRIQLCNSLVTNNQVLATRITDTEHA